MTEVMVDILRRHFPDGEFPQNPATIQLILAVGLMEAGLSIPLQRHEGALEDLKALAQRMGLSQSSLETDSLYGHMRFLFERTLTLERTTVAGIQLPMCQAQLLLARGSGSGQDEFGTFFSATILSREQEGRTRFTTAFLPSVRFMRDQLQPFEDPLYTHIRPYVSGILTHKPFGVKIDQEATSFNAIGALQLQMRKAQMNRWPRTSLNPNALKPESVVGEWLQHFVADSPKGPSKYYGHFPRPANPPLVLG